MAKPQRPLRTNKPNKKHWAEQGTKKVSQQDQTNRDITNSIPSKRHNRYTTTPLDLNDEKAGQLVHETLFALRRGRLAALFGINNTEQQSNNSTQEPQQEPTLDSLFSGLNLD